VVACAIGIDDQNLLVADSPDVVFAFEKELSWSAVRFDLPLAWLAVSGDTNYALDHGYKLSLRQFFF